MSAETVKHPIFARAYTRFSAGLEREIGPYRAELTSGLHGRVLEVGAGNGMNFAHYGADLDEVVAIEPEPYLRARAIEAATVAKSTITVIDGDAGSLPSEDQSFDTVIFCLVLCSIGEPAQALSEAQRVLKPDGSIRFLEHIGSPRPAKARFQRFLDRSGVWPAIAGGCHCGLDTIGTMESSGLSVTDVSGMSIGPGWAHTNPHVMGRATPSGTQI